MSPKQLIPVSFASLMGQIIICTLLLQTSAKYPPYPASLADNPTLIAGCALIISCGLLQVGFLASGINLPHNRILFENCLCNAAAFLLLVWFALSLWVSSYILYIWGFLCIFPILNDIVGLVRVRYSAGRFHKFIIE